MIDFQRVNKNFGTQQVLVDANFRINRGERVGIVGPNGAGKSTVFALISGELTPDGGTVDVPRDCRLALVHQYIDASGIDRGLLAYTEGAVAEADEVHDEIERIEATIAALSGDERAQSLRRLGELQTRFEALGGYDVRNRAEYTLSGLGFRTRDFARPLAEFSGGWQMRAELARALVADPDVLLLDEPSNYLDIPAVEWLQRFLREFPGTLLLISHDRYLLNSLTTVTLEIANATATRYAGNYEHYVVDKEARFEQVARAQRNYEVKRQRAERFIERFRAKNTKASLVKSKIKMLERMETVETPRAVVSPGRIRLNPPPRSGHEVARLDDAGFSYDGNEWVLRNVELRVERGDKVALVGLNGTGKTTLLRLLAGKLEPTEGRRYLGHNVVSGYQSQDFAETMNPDLSAYEVVRGANTAVTEQYIRTLLGGFGFSGNAIEKPVGVLSGGEKVRLAFARLLVNPPSFLLLDEPTTHLDIAARQALEEALHDYEGTVYVVSHDIEFVRAVAGTIIAMDPPGVRRFWGGYDYYREKLAEEARQAADSTPAAKPSQNSSRPADRRTARRERAERVQEFSRRSRELKKTVATAEKRVAALEKEQEELAELLQPGSDPTKYAATSRRLKDLQDELDAITRTWETAATELEALEQAYAAT